MNVQRTLFTLLLLVWLAGCGGGAPNTIVEDFYRSLEAGETSKAAAMLSNSTRSFMGDAKLKAMMGEQTEAIQKKGGIAKITVTGEPKAELAVFDVVIDFKNGSQETDKVKLIKEDGDWKINKL